VVLRELTSKRLTCEELSKVLNDFPDLEINEYLRKLLKSGERIKSLTKEEKEEQERLLARLGKGAQSE
jgi:sulfur transfer protein SufE